MRIGYLIPEFPGQTHTWIWREITWMRRWGAAVEIFSTRPPPEDLRARHTFAGSAAAQTFYLWPAPPLRVIADLGWALCTRPGPLLRCIALALRLPVEPSPGWWRTLALIAPACGLAREARRRGLETFHSHSLANCSVLCMMARRLAGIRFSQTLHANPDWFGGAIAEKVAEAEFTVSVARWMLDDLRGRCPELPAERFLLASMGVDTAEWDPRVHPRKVSAHPRIATVGRLQASKGHDVLLRATAQLRQKGWEVSLRVIGAGPERTALQLVAEQLGIAPHVEFLGSLAEHRVREELGAADVFALASHAEALGVVYMEAMAMEVATVGTRVGGVPEIITDGVDGLLVSPGNPAELAQALERLLSDPALRHELGKAGRQTIVQRFDSRLGAARLFERWTGRWPRDGGADPPAPD